MGSDQSHFYGSLTVRDKVTRQCPQTTISEEKGEPERIRTDVPLLTSLTPSARPNRLTAVAKDRGKLTSARGEGQGPLGGASSRCS